MYKAGRALRMRVKRIVRCQDEIILDWNELGTLQRDMSMAEMLDMLHELKAPYAAPLTCEIEIR